MAPTGHGVPPEHRPQHGAVRFPGEDCILQEPCVRRDLARSGHTDDFSAYEITTFHKRDPPPKEILEDLTAKGGDLLNRTLENYHRRAHPREVDILANGAESETDDNEHTTPKADRMDLDDAPGSSGRVTRGTQSPPTVVLTHSIRFAPCTPAASFVRPAARLRLCEACQGHVQQLPDPGQRGPHEWVPRRFRGGTVHCHLRAAPKRPVPGQGRSNPCKQSPRISRSGVETEGQPSAEPGHYPGQRHDDAGK
jgi:hypothetical protein